MRFDSGSVTYTPIETVTDRCPLTSSVLVATDGQPSHDGAVRIAASLAERGGGTLQVISVIPPTLPYSAATTDLGLVRPIASQRSHRTTRLAVIREQMKRLGVEQWKVAVLSGWPGIQIAAAARRLQSTLIVMGLGRHLPLDRLFGTETALEVVRWASVPVLAVVGDRMPLRGLVAADLDESSATTARIAAELLGPENDLELVHVRPPSEDATGEPPTPPFVRVHTEPRLTELAREVDPALRGHVETLVLHGDPAGEILAHAEASGTDLIAVGRAHHTAREHAFRGSLTERLMRGAHCSVLVTPGIKSGAEMQPTQRECAGGEELMSLPTG